MKTTAKLLLSTLALVSIMLACGNSKPKSNSPQEQEVKTQEQTSDNIKSEDILKIDFENNKRGMLPESWLEYYAGEGGTEWKVTDDNGNNVIAQLSSDNPNSHFNIVVNDSIVAKDMTLTARLKGVTGKYDQGGGFVWRFTDKNNYYVVRANPLEDNIVLYKVENGKRTDLPLIGEGRTYGAKVEPMGNTWHTLKLIVKGNLFTVFLDAKELFKVQDETFKNEGKIGFWTKADAVTYFDDFEIEKH